MVQQQPSNLTCFACGATLAPALRYCLACYRPVANKNRERAHIDAVSAVNTTLGADPTIVFSPGEHEILLRRSRRRKRLILLGSVALSVIVATSVTVATLNRRWAAAERAGQREQMARRELRLLADGLERFRVDMGRYPTDREGIGALTRKTAATRASDSDVVSHWMGPYIDGVFEVDPWGNDYVYHLTDGGESFSLLSYGPEGEGSSRPPLRVTSNPSLNF